MKLTVKQMEVLKKMAAGWELGKSTTFDGKAWLQENGVGRGGKSVDVHVSTFHALYTRGLINSDNQPAFPTRLYFLTPAGRKFLEDSNA